MSLDNEMSLEQIEIEMTTENYTQSKFRIIKHILKDASTQYSFSLSIRNVAKRGLKNCNGQGIRKFSERLYPLEMSEATHIESY